METSIGDDGVFREGDTEAAGQSFAIGLLINVHTC